MSSDLESLVQILIEERNKTSKSVLEFDYNKKRIKILSSETNVKAESAGIVYWMSREMRVQDNWSFLFAQKLALKNKLPLHVLFFLLPKFLDASARHFKFLLKGLAEVSKECSELNIPFYLYSGEVEVELPKIVKDCNIGAVVCDFSPLRTFKSWISKVESDLPKDVVFCQVDGHNIVPCWEASPKQEYAARTIRPKIMKQLDHFLTPFPPVIKHPYTGKLDIEVDDKIWSKYDDANLPDWISPGYRSGIEMLDSFCKKRMKIFCKERNNPAINASSNLSPWMHFGQIAPQRCVLEVTKYKNKYLESFNSFCEEIIVRRELSDNFCFYNENYDNIEGCASWARITLNDHRKDKRTHIYTQEQFEEAKTHDPLWNAAQIELVEKGKMHGFLRMYWAKKILEWTPSPEEALRIGIYLNDRYSFDGRDPNGYVGLMWSICGIHDQGWREREVFGKIRYMNFAGCKRKFDVPKYIANNKQNSVAKKQKSIADNKQNSAAKKQKLSDD